MFQDRRDAGEQLSRLLTDYNNKTVVYALPRGGVVVAEVVAKKLKAPLELLIPRKIGHPYNPEYAIGAVTEHGKPILDETETAYVSKVWLESEITKQREEAKRRRKLYVGNKKPASVAGKTAIIVDDGIATGLTMFAAIDELKELRPKKIIVAIPVMPKDTVQKLKTLVDQVIAIEIPDFFRGAIGAYYDNFRQVEDEEVIKILKLNRDTRKD